LTVGHPTIIGQDGLSQDLGEKDGAAAGLELKRGIIKGRLREKQ